ncbi:hypothetical protein ATCC90586_011834 [Pythium insidiosum]|nr:hypothetical protein ATCC90586_011834 [Pythium insidiosum]
MDLARRLGLQLSFKDRLKVKGVGDVTTYVTGRTRIKITLGVSVVYYMDIWCGNIGEGVQCLLGMDFMVSAGVRLSAFDGMVRLPNEESVRLVSSSPFPKLPKKIPICTQEDISIGAGRPKSIRITNVTQRPIVVTGRTTVGHLVEAGHLPDCGEKDRAVRAGSPKYDEWQHLIFENSFSREFAPDQDFD